MTSGAALLNPGAAEADAVSREERARRLAMRFSASDAQDILAHAIREEFADGIALVSSFGAESAVLLHMAAEIDRSLPVLFLETGKHFAQTLSYKKKLVQRLGLINVRDLRPDEGDLSKDDPQGDLWKTDADACCTLRKVRPLDGALKEFDAWITGRKQFHGGGRSSLPAFEDNATHIKVNPLIRWNKDDVQNYMKTHDLPQHPLIGQGYPSIGCWPCTHPVAAGDDVRAGRWRGAAKTECGIHGR